MQRPPNAPMHHCLCVTEILCLIFEIVRCWDDNQPRLKARVGKRTLASLAGTCQMFTPLALDALWHELDSLDPLLRISSIAASSSNDPRWLTFRQYAKRVKTLRGQKTRASAHVQQEFITSLEHCPRFYLPLLPNVTELEWCEDRGILSLEYFAGPSLTALLLSLMRFPEYSSAELSLLADLPKLCPNVTSFSLVHHFLDIYDPSREVGKMVTQWPRLRALRTCAIPQSSMDALFSQQSLESLRIDYHTTSPVYSGRIPGTLCEFTLAADCPTSCTRFLETAYVCPTKVCLLLNMSDAREEADAEETFSLLPSRLDTSHLLSLTIRPKLGIVGIPYFHPVRLRQPLTSALIEFKVLHELDLDYLCTAQSSDADIDCLAGSLLHLRILKLGTANPSVTWPRPVASVGAVIAVLRHCRYLETLHILFNGSILPPWLSAARDVKEPLAEGLFGGVCNRRITKLRVGYSPITAATVNVMASCFKSIMPSLVLIEGKDKEEEWRLVQNLLAV